jgi:hypothetical protein
MDPMNDKTPETEVSQDEDRRKFLAACGRFAVITPPALTMLLSTSLTSKAIARSGGNSDHDRDDRGEKHDNDDHRGKGWFDNLFGD